MYTGSVNVWVAPRSGPGRPVHRPPVQSSPNYAALISGEVCNFQVCAVTPRSSRRRWAQKGVVFPITKASADDEIGSSIVVAKDHGWP